MNDNANVELFDEFKNKLFKIGFKSCRSEQKNSEESYKTFIEYSFKQAIDYMNMYLAIGCDVFLHDDQKNSLDKIDNSHELDGVFTLYCQLVKTHKPFTDLFSLLHEDLLLSGRRGEGLGRFYTPPSFADGLAELMPVVGNKLLVGDICSGAGSLKLAALKRLANENPESLGCLSIVLTDIDELACKVAFLQIAANMIVNRTPIGSVKMFRCNLITEWRTAGTLMVQYKAPDSVIKRSLKARKVKTFNEVIGMVRNGLQGSTKAVTS